MDDHMEFEVVKILSQDVHSVNITVLDRRGKQHTVWLGRSLITVRQEKKYAGKWNVQFVRMKHTTAKWAGIV